MNPRHDPRVDAFIAKSADFARPILTHLRALVHEACPTATETIKWGMPHFEHAGSILCMMGAFKAHCAFGFWHQDMEKIAGPHRASPEDAMGSLGRLTSLGSLPSDAVLKRLVRASARLIESGAPGRSRPAKPAKAPPVPADLAAALKRHAAAAKVFAAFPPGKRKDYIEWITGAKRDATRQARLATAIQWIAEGKGRNWKYENC
ncbi:MAG: YdeI/OmpD-associated family protein [Opitutaceae bacterium]|nr:YdeI/OmpD-associated family protein [Opitutaceae bacterium]